MQTFALTLLVFLVAVAAMAIGVLVAGRRLRGSCGGTGEDCHCDEEAQASCALKARQKAQQASQA